MSAFQSYYRKNLHRIVSLLLVTLIGCRVLFLILLPHTDTSEARYAEISRKMVETGDWITPQFDYGIPFWAKPPLSMWTSALGIELFGANEFGSRIFIFIAAMGLLAIVAGAVRRESDRTSGLVAVTLLMGMPLFYYCSAAVMTDLTLALGTTLAMVGFRSSVLLDSKRWGYGFFIGLAIGLLAKGPLALVLAVPPIMGWVLLTGQWKRAWRAVPWVSGTLLMLVLALPWYLIAEVKTPGFLNYFIVGEHWMRFVIKGWEGDLYGNAHSETPGTIWVYWAMVTFPWCLGLFAIPFRKWREARAWSMAQDGRGLYLVLWALWPLVFFTPSRNIIATYPLPALPALAILLAEIVRYSARDDFSWRRLHPLHPSLAGTYLAIILLLGFVSSFVPDLAPKRTEKDLVKVFHEKRESEDQLLYFGRRKYSAEFYSGGEATSTNSIDALKLRLNSPDRLFVAISKKQMNQLPAEVQSRLLPVTDWQEKRINLYVELNPDLDTVKIDTLEIQANDK
jgi:4-amino-4-deoxy-L-arabinose transferase-like glycosyltransferase